MPWRLVQWKDCDGGCERRSPTFPNQPNPTPVAGRHSDYMAGDRFQLSDLPGTSPDGRQFVGGHLLHKELWALYESVGRKPRRIQRRDLEALPGFGQLFALDWPLQGAWKGNAIQWFLDRDFGWPARGPHVQAILDRMAALGLWDPTLYDPGIDYGTIYPDDDAEIVETTDYGSQVSIHGQSFHVRHDMSDAERAAAEPACCHLWLRVDDGGNPI